MSPAWIEAIRWGDRRIRVELTRQAIRDAPGYDPTVGVTREYEERLHGSYGREGYWTAGGEPRGPERRRLA